MTSPFSDADLKDIAETNRARVSYKAVAEIVDYVVRSLVDEHGWIAPLVGAAEIALVDQVATETREIDANVSLGLNASGTVVAIYLSDPPIEIIDCS
jgi:hypothetical protein